MATEVDSQDMANSEKLVTTRVDNLATDSSEKSVTTEAGNLATNPATVKSERLVAAQVDNPATVRSERLEAMEVDRLATVIREENSVESLTTERAEASILIIKGGDLFRGIARANMVSLGSKSHSLASTTVKAKNRLGPRDSTMTNP